MKYEERYNTSFIGQKYGRARITAVSSKRASSGNVYVFAQCDCGQLFEVRLGNLKNGTTSSCGCFRRERAIAMHASITSKLPKRTKKGEAGFNRLLDSYKRNAETRGYEFGLTKEQFRELTQKDCHYCGAPPSMIMVPTTVTTDSGKEHSQYIYNGVDRMDNALGYLPKNSVSCCAFCNNAKGSETYENFLAKASAIYHRRVFLLESDSNKKAS